MPNWTTNEVTFSSTKTTNIKKIKDIFEKGCPFDQLIKEPNWPTVPLKGNETTNRYENKPLGMVGELPIIENLMLNNGEIMTLFKFKSTNAQDTRWYDWRLEKWDTKWDVPKEDIEIVDIDDLSGRTLVVGFNTAWCPPYSIYKKLRDKFKDVKIEWWARDEDDQTNGEGYYLK